MYLATTSIFRCPARPKTSSRASAPSRMDWYPHADVHPRDALLAECASRYSGRPLLLVVMAVMRTIRTTLTRSVDG